MLWLVLATASHSIIACNIHQEDDVYQLWVTRANGKSLKIDESHDFNTVAELRNAIDYAIENGDPVLRLA